MNKITLYLASIFSIIAGGLHATIVAFEHVATLPLETVFFLVGGIAQIVFAVLFLRSKRVKHAGVLFVVNGALASVWGLTRMFRAPFMDTPEGVGALGLSVFLLELGTMASIAIWKWSKKHSIKDIYGYSYAGVIVGAVIVSLLAGSFVYAGGRLGEVVMPDRELNHNHAHGGHSEKDNNGHHTSPSEDKEQEEDNKEQEETSNTKQKEENKEKDNMETSEDSGHGHSDEHIHN